MFDKIVNNILGRKNASAHDSSQVTFNLVTKFTDSDREEDIRGFGTAEEREDYLAKLLTSPTNVRAVASLVYEDTLLFWTRHRRGEALPIVAPDLPGEGELVLQFLGHNISFEATGLEMKQASEKADQFAQEYGAIKKISVIRRIVAHERYSVLIKRGDSIPASALKIESAEYASDDE